PSQLEAQVFSLTLELLHPHAVIGSLLLRSLQRRPCLRVRGGLDLELLGVPRTLRLELLRSPAELSLQLLDPGPRLRSLALRLLERDPRLGVLRMFPLQLLDPRPGLCRLAPRLLQCLSRHGVRRNLGVERIGPHGKLRLLLLLCPRSAGLVAQRPSCFLRGGQLLPQGIALRPCRLERGGLISETVPLLRQRRDPGIALLHLGAKLLPRRGSFVAHLLLGCVE